MFSEFRTEKGPVEKFNTQIADIQRAGYPASLDCVVVPALSASGLFSDQRKIENIIFPYGLSD